MVSAQKGRGFQIADVGIVLAIAFIGGAIYFAMSLSSKPYPATAAQHAFAERFCVGTQHGTVSSVSISKPDIFGSNGAQPRLSVRCGFGKNRYMLQTYDLASSSAVPK